MKTIFKVEPSDLVGDIKDFPIEVVEKMIGEQVRQGNLPNVEVFQKNVTSDVEHGGFDWNKSDDDSIFWIEIIEGVNFELFFERYPKKAKLVYIVGDNKIGMDIIKALEKYGGINRHGYNGSSDNNLYYIEPINNTIEMCSCDGSDKLLYEMLLATYTAINAKENILEVTMEEVAKKFGVGVSNIRIKS